MSPTPVTNADLKKINQSMAQLNDMQGLIDKAKASGVDTSEAELVRGRLYEWLSNFRQVWFPGK